MRFLATALATALLALAAALPAGASAAHGKRLPQLASRVKVAKHRHHRPKRRGTGAAQAPAGSRKTGSGSGGSQTSKPAPKPAPAPTPAPTPAPEPGPTDSRLLFATNFDGSFRGWYVQSLSTRATISTAHPFAGSGAGRLEVRPGDVEPDTGNQRSEVSGPDFNAGEDIYVRDEIRIPDGYTFQGPWQLIDQLHEEEWGGSPGIATFLEPSRAIRFGAGDGSPKYWQGPVLEPERWYTLVYRVYLSQDPNQGFVELWLDGVQQMLLNGSTRMYGETIQTGQTYIKAGIYRSQFSTGVSVIEHDDIAVGTSMAAVMAF